MKRQTRQQVAMRLAYAQMLARGENRQEAYCKARGIDKWTIADQVTEGRWYQEPSVVAILEAAADARVERLHPTVQLLTWDEVAELTASVARIDHQGDPNKAKVVLDALRFWRSAFGTARSITVRADVVAEVLALDDTTGL